MDKQVAVVIRLEDKPWLVVVEVLNSGGWSPLRENYLLLTVLNSGRRVLRVHFNLTSPHSINEQLERKVHPQTLAEIPTQLLFATERALLLAHDYAKQIWSQLPSIYLN